MDWLKRFWDWVDNRDIEKHLVCVAVLYGVYRITLWCFHFAETSQRPGGDIAAIIIAITGPYGVITTAVCTYYFAVRKQS